MADADTADSAGTADTADQSVWQTQLDLWRAQQADKRDPVRFHLIEALARRSATYTGEARRVLDARLQTLVDAFSKALTGGAAPDAEGSAATVPEGGVAAASSSLSPPSPPSPLSPLSPLSALIADMTQRVGERPARSVASSKRPANTTPAARPASPASFVAPSATAPAPATLPAAPPAPPSVIATDDSFEDMDVLEYFRETWSKLSTDGNLRQSLAQVPENAGPLNSSHLVHRALSLMHDVSPDYLRHFLRHADALSWLEDMDSAGAMRNKSAARVAASAKPSRAKAR
ncbi:DUF2894 domain-containing protein [Pandoraea norimbergensis]|uniref:DUF2894 domain-containing protein n=1 Tax=Pandoraea norimbergensis TaxID=93219 RepID=A0ABN4JE08_9BURK|nr:DUF2894 domain-containing protein [Pandoraea norimbergensis]ALS59105.1 hypothetical protein AT302_04360 [Pandoraea norimbergensis]